MINELMLKNMKYTLLFSFSIFISIGFSQNEMPKSKYKLGVNLDCFGRIYNQYGWTNLGLSFSPLLSLTKPKHQIEIGPQILPAFPGNNKVKQFGLLTNFKFFPNGFQNKINAFFNVSVPINYSFCNDQQSIENNVFDALQLISLNGNVQLYSINVQLGYGVSFKLGNKCYLGSTFSLCYGNGLRILKSYDASNTFVSKRINNVMSFYATLGLNIGFRF